jgi:exportin-1
MADVVARLGRHIADDAPRILEAVFEPTLAMITKNFSDFPEHRLAFFKLLDAINTHCFEALFRVSPAHQKLVVDSVVWAFNHTARDIGEMGLGILTGLLQNVFAKTTSDVAQPFYAAHLLVLLKDLMLVLTDRLHKAHLKLHAVILQKICQLVASGAVTTALWECPFAASSGTAARFQAFVGAAVAANGGALPAGALSNVNFVRFFVRMLVESSFANLSQAQVGAFAEGLFDLSKDVKAYKRHLVRSPLQARAAGARARPAPALTPLPPRALSPHSATSSSRY